MSSFRQRFPWLIPCYAVIFIAVWGPLVSLTGGPAEGPGQNQWASNHLDISHLLYGDESPHTLIVGSSLTARLRREMLPAGWHNLGLRGGSSLTGLALSQGLTTPPKLVIIEANLFEKPADGEMLGSALDQPLASLRSIIPALRIDHQPANVGLAWLRRWRGERSASNDKVTINQETLQRFVQLHLSNHDETARAQAEPLINNALAEIQRHIEQFEQTGSRCVLLWMPTDPAIEASPLMTYRKQRLLQAFGHERLLIVQPEDRRTNDGLHLIYPAAVDTTRALIEALYEQQGDAAEPATNGSGQ